MGGLIVMNGGTPAVFARFVGMVMFEVYLAG
jgi:hypothetical protein